MSKLGGSRRGATETGGGGSADPGAKPGGRTLTMALVQRRASARAPSGPEVHEAAAHGPSGPAQELPFRAQIQQSFGAHDISATRAPGFITALLN